jgi:hypothetical protein
VKKRMSVVSPDEDSISHGSTGTTSGGQGDDSSEIISPRQSNEKILSVPASFLARSSPLRSSLRKHGGRQKSPGRKTVSFCSNNSEKKVSNVTDCFQYMQNGTEMVKLRTNVRQFRRVFSLDADLSHIRWTPTNKKPHKARSM